MWAALQVFMIGQQYFQQKPNHFCEIIIKEITVYSSINIMMAE
jgi:hypothetical protein